MRRILDYDIDQGGVGMGRTRQRRELRRRPPGKQNRVGYPRIASLVRLYDTRID